MGPTGPTGVVGATGAMGATGVAGSGLSISKIFAFHTDTYAGQPDPGSPEAVTTAIGDIQVVKFSDGSSYLSVSGHAFDSDPVVGGGGGSVVSVRPFSNEMFFKASGTEQEAILKFMNYVNMRIRYRLNAALAIPSIKIAIDSDLNFGDNTDIAYALTEK